MYYKTLESISSLFAVAANKQTSESNEKFEIVFHSFLMSEIETKHIDKFLETFRQNLFFYSSLKSEKKVSRNSVRIIKICEEVKAHLSVSERLLVLFYLIELVNQTSSEKQSYEFVELISEMFGFDNQFLESFASFIKSENYSNSYSLVFDNKIIGEIFFTDFELLFLKPLNDNLKVNGRKLPLNKVCYLGKDSVLIYNDSKKFFYPELISQKIIGENKSEFLLVVNDLRLRKSKRTILNNVSISVKSGEFVGIIGKSGCGKTSFLKCISGDEKRAEGQICFTNSAGDIHSKKLSFVSQFDHFIPLFTTEEHLEQRCDFLQIADDVKSQVINVVLKETGLIGEKDKKVIKTDNSPFEVSGGQQKRLSIAMELIADPDVLLLDEPISGLSSEDSYMIMSLLKNLTSKNKIVIASVHQPDFDIFMIFDKILIIDEGGFPIYFGTPTKAADYFRDKTGRIDNNTLVEARYNPAVLLKLVDDKEYDEQGLILNKRKVAPETFYKWFTEDFKPIALKPLKKEKITYKQKHFLSFINQLKFSIKLDLKNLSRLILLFLIPLLTGVIFSFLVRYSPGENYTYYYNPNVPVWILIILTTSVFIGLVSSGHEFIQLREYHNCENRNINKSLSLSFASISKYFLLSLFQTLVLVLPSVLIIENGFHFFILYIISFLLVFWGSLFGLLLSAFSKTTGIVYLLIPLIIIPQLVFSGALINFGSFNKALGTKSKIPHCADFVPMRWASEAVITDFYCNNPYFKDLYIPNQYLSNAIYYRDYFLPKMEELAEKDSAQMKIFVNSEQINPGFVNLPVSKKYNVFEYEKYYAIEIELNRKVIDSIHFKQKNPELLLKKYSNVAVNKVINNFENQLSFDMFPNRLERRYMPIYMLPETVGAERLFMIGNKGLYGFVLRTTWYNIIMLTIYNFALIAVIILYQYVRRRSRMYK